MNQDRHIVEQEIQRDCVRIWQILIPRGAEARSISYTDLAARSGVDRKKLQGNSEILRRIHAHCNRYGVGPICVLVVDGKYWVPRKGYRVLRSQEADYPGDDDLICVDRERVRLTNWAQVPEPKPGHFAYEL